MTKRGEVNGSIFSTYRVEHKEVNVTLKKRPVDFLVKVQQTIA